jgi:hypothetical protein
MTTRGTLVSCLLFSLILNVYVQASALDEQFLILPYQKVTKALRLENSSAIIEKGSTVATTVRSSGVGQNNSINFYVTDSNNNTIFRYDDLSYASFSFIVPITGNYTLHFDNSLSMYLKSITLNYSIKPPIFGIPQDQFYFMLEVAIAVIVAIVIIIVAIAFRKHMRSKRPRQEYTRVKNVGTPQISLKSL